MKSRVLCLLVPTLPLLLFACDDSLLDSGGGSGGTAATGGAGGAGEVIGKTIDTFEDGDVENELGTNWYVYTDNDAKGASSVAGPDSDDWVVAPGHDSSDAIHLAFQFSKADYEYDPFVGVGFPVPTSTAFGDYEGISYYYQGAAHTVRFETSNVADYDYYVMNLPAVTTWTHVTIPFSQLAQAGYGAKVPWDPSLLLQINWHIVGKDGATGNFALDDVFLLDSAPIDRGPKNLTLRDPAPPQRTKLASVSIPGALQQKAMAQLDKGYNLTNWLEAGRFDGTFVFDEDYLTKLAGHGFQAVRLPIDLDLYVNDVSGTGDATTLTIDDDLWTVLDSFEQWTATAGLSLTIDYHQYDASFSFDDAGGVDEAVALWKAVAAHFKDNSRDDLYFELLNEPELSTGASTILAASSWTPVATRMIDAIRSEDATHTIIFGDVNWYGIDQLAAREPFADDNIVYSFHSYEPFIFTHQGADWAQMGTTHDVPFPYTKERWSEYGSDFGLSAAQPAWIVDQYQQYYIQGTVDAMWNRIVVAKKWGIDHGVPVICNEFGAYDRTSKLEDRVAYYDALLGMYADLEIPWQHWFMIMSDDGTIAPEYIDAFGLD